MKRNLKICDLRKILLGSLNQRWAERVARMGEMRNACTILKQTYLDIFQQLNLPFCGPSMVGGVRYRGNILTRLSLNKQPT
jgi:hypothetical protein